MTIISSPEQHALQLKEYDFTGAKYAEIQLVINAFTIKNWAQHKLLFNRLN